MVWRSESKTLLLVIELFSCIIEFVHGRVSPNFQGCTKFFLQQSPPSGFHISGSSYKYICQNNNNNLPDVLATLYDTEHEIPTYSAYIMDRNVHSGRPKSWHTELDIDPSKQAHDSDYKYNIFDRGHLCPSIYISKLHRPAAFTLTNAVPQYGYFNQHLWNKAEQEGQKLMLKSCAQGKAYFITGAIPGLDTMTTKHDSQIVNTKVNVPSHMYTAACCKLYSGESFSFGYLGKNIDSNKTTKHEDLMAVMDIKLLGRKVTQKYYHLLYPQSIAFFNDQCDYANNTGVNFMAKALNVPVTSAAASKHVGLICFLVVVMYFIVK